MFMKTALTTPSEQTTTLVRETAMFDRDWDESVMEYWLYINDSILERNMVHLEATMNAQADDCPSILMEGLKDAGHKFLHFLKELIQRLKEFWGQVVLFFRTHFASIDSLIRNHRELFNKDFTPFTITGYTFTTNNFNLPAVTVGELIGDFNGLMNRLKDLDKATIEETRQQWVSEDALDRIRGSVLKTPDVTAEEFQARLKENLRGGATDTDEIEISPSNVSNLIQSYTSSKETYKKLDKEHQKMIQGLERLQSFFKSEPYTSYKGSEKMVRTRNIEDREGQPVIGGSTYHQMGHLEKINAIYNMCWTRTEKVSAITSMTISTVSTSMRDEIKQTRAILRKIVTTKTKKEPKEESK